MCFCVYCVCMIFLYVCLIQLFEAESNKRFVVLHFLPSFTRSFYRGWGTGASIACCRYSSGSAIGSVGDARAMLRCSSSTSSSYLCIYCLLKYLLSYVLEGVVSTDVICNCAAYKVIFIIQAAIWWIITSPLVGRGWWSIAMSVFSSVCCVCPSARVSQEPVVRTLPNCLCILARLCLGPALPALRFLMYFWFCRWRYFCTY